MLGYGIDLIVAGERREETKASLETTLVAAGEEAVETWRIRRGVPRFPIDFGTDSLPSEASLESAIDFEKGCFLGQESVAKVRNLGHPPRMVVALRAAVPVAAGEPVLAGREEVGTVTSAAYEGGGSSALIARIKWEAREESLRTSAGTRLAAPETVS